MTGVRSLRGDVNVILNGLVRDGVIESFETNFNNHASLALGLHIRVLANLGATPRSSAFDARRRDLRDSIMRQLEPVAPGVIVSVRGTPATAGPKAVTPPTNGGITGEQCRAARRLLGWSMHEHAHVAGVGVHAVGNFERGETVPRAETLAAIVGALTRAGIELTDEGVRLRPEALKRKRS